MLEATMAYFPFTIILVVPGDFILTDLFIEIYNIHLAMVLGKPAYCHSLNLIIFRVALTLLSLKVYAAY